MKLPKFLNTMPYKYREKTQKVTTTEVILPMDIITTEIFPRLPPKSLLRFKCVSKFFNTLIPSPEFINLQLCHSQSSYANRFVVFSGYDDNLYSANLDSSLPELSVVKLPFPFIGHLDGIFLVGSCNGLLCLDSFFHECFILLNPLTRMYRKITGEIYKKYTSTPYSHYNVHYSFGFGGDGNDDYKICVIIEHVQLNGDVAERKVMLYSLKAESWRLACKTSSICLDSMFGMENGNLIDNHIHWMFWNPSEFKHRIGCFDFCNEQWGKDVPLPDEHLVNWARMQQSHSSRAKYMVRLGVLADGCLFLSTKYDSRQEVDFWLMKEYGVKESWFKFLRVSDSDVAPSIDWKKFPPMAYARRFNNEILFRDDSKSRLFWYNIADKTYQSLGDENFRVSSYVVCLYNRSLVSIPGGEPILEPKKSSTPSFYQALINGTRHS